MDSIAGRVPPGLNRWGLWGLLMGFGIIFALLVAGMIFIPRFQAAHPFTAYQKSDADRSAIDDMFLDVTLVTPQFLQSRNLGRYLGDRDPDQVLPVLVGVNTHSGNLACIQHVDGHFFLVGPDGADYPSVADPIVMSEHHNAYMILFPSRDNLGRRFLEMKRGRLTVQVVGMGKATLCGEGGKTSLRQFTWDLPLTGDPAFRVHGFSGIFILAVALIGALLVILSPCALELSLYYSAIISCTVAEGENDARGTTGFEAVKRGRKRVLLNLCSFVVGFTILYAISGATVGMIGQGIREPLKEYGRIIQVFGGSLILLFAGRVVGLGRFMGKIPNGKLHLGTLFHKISPLGLLRRVSQKAMASRPKDKSTGGLRALDSFLVGVGLSSSCLTCMGGAVLYPLLVYAGISNWYSGLITLSVYSLCIAAPMAMIALGFFNVRMALGRRLGFNRFLRVTSGILLAVIGILVITGSDRILTDITFKFLGRVSQWLS